MSELEPVEPAMMAEAPAEPEEKAPTKAEAKAAAKQVDQAALVARLDSMAPDDLISGWYGSKTPAEILKALLKGTGISLGNVTDAKEPTISAIRFDGEPLRACIEKLARPVGATWALNGGALDFTFEVA
jgi:hypothetical protein